MVSLSVQDVFMYKFFHRRCDAMKIVNNMNMSAGKYPIDDI